jgi:hypothetical protein
MEPSEVWEKESSDEKTTLEIKVRNEGRVYVKIGHPYTWRAHTMSIDEFRELMEKGPDVLERAEKTERLVN